jgi:hypothetical protein
MQRDGHQAAADLATDMPYGTASAMLEWLSGIAVGSERLHTLTHQVAKGLSIFDVVAYVGRGQGVPVLSA